MSHKHTNFYKERSWHLPLVWGVIVLAIWQITFFQKTLKWDAIDITLPWRYFVSDALLNGIIPWWNPYQLQGFAQGLSLETWYPIAWILGVADGYDLYSLNLEYVLHLLIASYGIYRLCLVSGIDQSGALWGALAFPLSGFFIGNAQHMGWICSGAWVPHVFAFFICWTRHQNLKTGLALVLSCYMLVSGGYVAFSIIVAYILGIGLGWFFFKKQREKKDAARQILTLLLGLTLVLSVLIVCLWQLKTQIDRGAGLSGEGILKGSYRLKHLVSLLFPLPTVKGPYELWQNDQSMINVYLGVIAPVLACISLKHLTWKFYRKWWTFGLIGLGLALAVELPLRSWANALPFFDLFRYPSLFRYFFLLALTMICAKVIDDQQSDPDGFKKNIYKGIQILLLIYGGTFLFIVIKSFSSIENILRLSIDTAIEGFAFQSLFYFALLSILLTSLKLVQKKKHFFSVLFVFIALDSVFHAQLNGRVSLFSEDSFSTVQQCLNNLPQKYPIPSDAELIISNKDQGLQLGPVYRNTNTLFKRVGWDGYTPYQYQKFIEFEKSKYYEKNLNLPALYFSAHAFAPTGVKNTESRPRLHLKPGEMEILDFGLNFIEVGLNLEEKGTVVYNQNCTPEWKVYLDKEKSHLIEIDIALMGVHVPKGNHVVRFEYSPGRLLNSLIISMVSLLLCCLFYFWKVRHSNGHRVLLGIIVIVISIFGKNFIYRKNEKVNKPPPERFLDRGDFERFKEWVMVQPHLFSYTYQPYCNFHNEIFLDYLRSNYIVLDSSKMDRNAIQYNFSKKKSDILFQSYCGFEGANTTWQNSGIHLRFEKNNTFQSLEGTDYGALLKIDLKPYHSKNVKKIEIDFKYRCPSSPESSVVFALLNEKGEVILWKSQRLSGSEEWSAYEWVRDVDDQFYESRYLSVYIWNKGKNRLDIDDMSVVMRQYRE